MLLKGIPFSLLNLALFQVGFILSLFYFSFSFILNEFSFSDPENVSHEKPIVIQP